MERVVNQVVDENNSIQKAFLDGIELVFSLMFTQKCKMYFLDEVSTVRNVYDETPLKVYGEPIDLVAKVIYNHPKGDEPEETVIRKATIKIPTKQFITNDIGFMYESDWEKFRKAKFSYEGCEYLVDAVKPMTMVADIWQFFEFYCTEDKKTSGGA